MIEQVAPLIAVAQVKPAREKEERRENVFRHGALVSQSARGGYDDIRGPKVGAEQITRSRRGLMDPLQMRGANSDILHWRPTEQNNLSGRERPIALIKARRWIFAIPKIPIDGPLRPGRAELAFEPAASVVDVDSRVDRSNSIEHHVAQLG